MMRVASVVIVFVMRLMMVMDLHNVMFLMVLCRSRRVVVI